MTPCAISVRAISHGRKRSPACAGDDSPDAAVGGPDRVGAAQIVTALVVGARHIFRRRGATPLPALTMT